MRNKRFIGWLWIPFAIIFAIFAWLSTSQLMNNDIWSVIINALMIAIVLLIYLACSVRFGKVAKAIKDLRKATAKMEEDHSKLNDYLYEVYKDDNPLEFKQELLSKQYAAYVNEMTRADSNSLERNRCDIADYINYDLIDSLINKSTLNLVAGVMTGLGILGTFIGLTIGLQQFNTGTAEEIAASIAPLMNGIKVAFHTSMYGMGFSLTFNYGYRKQLDAGYKAVDEFLTTYERCVAPDSQNNAQKAVADLPVNIAEAVKPYFTELSSKLDGFANQVSSNQVDGFAKLVEKFVDSMNESLGDNFKQLSLTIADTCEMQRKTNDIMNEVLSDIKNVSADTIKIHEESEKIIEKMSEYINDIEELQEIINENMMSVNLQNEENSKLYATAEGYIAKVAAMQTTFDTSAKNVLELQSKVTTALDKNVESIEKLNSKASDDMKSAAKQLAESAEMFNGGLEDSLNKTFDAFDKELSEITTALSTTISRIDATTGKVPATVSEAYKRLQQTFEEMESRLEVLAVVLKDTADTIKNESKK